jgi:XTP/dITP diphosphohydrolase
MPRKIVMASSNPGKLAEIRALLADVDVIVVPQSEFGIHDVVESGLTFAENAEIKARHAACVTGLPAIADDSGLTVDALHGAPGVFSARYSGADANDAKNIDKLLLELRDVAAAERGAAFRCAVCFVMSKDGEAVLAEGEWPGRILEARRGAGGFGYDPVFFDPEAGMSAAEMNAGQKNARSHRGKAFRALAAKLRSRQ